MRRSVIHCLSLWGAFQVCPAEVPRIPVEDFFKTAGFSRVSLSPDGKYLAFISPFEEDRNSLGFAAIEGKSNPVVTYPDPGSDYGNYSWLNNEEVIYGITVWNQYSGGLLKTHRATLKSVYLADRRVGVRVVNPLVNDKDHASVWVFDSTEQMRKGLRKISTGSRGTFYERIRETIPEPEKETGRWWFDWNDMLRLVLCARKSDLVYLHRWNKDDDWSSIGLNPEQWRVWAFTENNNELIVSGYGRFDTEGLYFFDLEKQKLSECHFRDERYDFGATARLAFYGPTGQLLGIRYERSGPSMVWFEPGMKEIQKLVDSKLPGKKANIVADWNTEMTRFLIASYSERDPGTYYILDVENHTFGQLFPSRPWIKTEQLARTQILRIKTQDGLGLEAYYTQPRNGTKPFPAVVLVHGGPHLRDRFGFDSEVQFLANRGYAVLQVNYRGSSGFGRKYSEAYQYAFRDMHKDVTYATRTLMDKGMIDPDRTAIMGGSFGG